MPRAPSPLKPSPLKPSPLTIDGGASPSQRRQRSRAADIRQELPLSSSRGTRFRAVGEPQPRPKGKGKAAKAKAMAKIDEASSMPRRTVESPATIDVTPSATPPTVQRRYSPSVYPSAPAITATRDATAAVEVRVGGSADVRADASLPNRISALVNMAYGTRRVDPYEVFQRLTLDGQTWPNRVLHLATRRGELVGVCSSTIQPGWTAKGVGQWGLLAVAPSSLGMGVASALVRAAEARLLACESVAAIEIEYEYSPGDAYAERLRAWYEGKLGFTCDDPSARFRRAARHIEGRTWPVAAPAPSDSGAADGSVQDGAETTNASTAPGHAGAQAQHAQVSKGAVLHPRPVRPPAAMAVLPPPVASVQ